MEDPNDIFDGYSSKTENEFDDWSLNPIAERMIDHAKWDLVVSAKKKGRTSQPDLFNDGIQISNKDSDELNQMDSLIWIFDLNPGGARMSFLECCAVLDLDPFVIRRIVANNMHSQLLKLNQHLPYMVSEGELITVREKLERYVNLN